MDIKGIIKVLIEIIVSKSHEVRELQEQLTAKDWQIDRLKTDIEHYRKMCTDAGLIKE